MAQLFLYIDPGSGSLLFQAVLSGIVTGLVFLKRILGFFKIKFGKSKSDEEI